MKLEEIRKQIDQLDTELVDMFVRRMELCAQVADYKKENNLPIHVPEREKMVLESVSVQSGQAMAPYIRELYKTLFSLSRNYQEERNSAAEQDHSSKQFGLLGQRLQHSYSPMIHACLGTYTYSLFEKEPDDLEAFLSTGEFEGLNVTMPYKKAVLPFCAELSPIAQLLGSVNTIVRRADGSLFGHNTDYYGFSSMLDRCCQPVDGQKVLVLGSGGASATVVAVLRARGAYPVVISRSGEENYSDLGKHTDAVMIVNTTPVGMYPDTQKSLVDLDLFPNLKLVLDLIYNPCRTKLLMEAEARGFKTQNGLWMLVAQAKESAEYFTGAPIPDIKLQQIYTHIQGQSENIVLIGMPGCGKSTVGKQLATVLNRPFVDVDEHVAEVAGKSVSEIIVCDGEDAFRRLETKVLQKLGKESGLVIATGGGCVTRAENYPLLHQNGRIYWLQRSIEALATEDRPLSKADCLELLYRNRQAMYEHFCDFRIDNNTLPNNAVRAILTQEEAI